MIKFDIKIFVTLVILSSCSQEENVSIKKQNKVASERLMLSHPISNQVYYYDEKNIKVNGAIYNISTAIEIIKSSKDLSPVPPIFFKIREVSHVQGLDFAKAAIANGLCKKTECTIKIEHPLD
jgi:hypothetical protein